MEDWNISTPIQINVSGHDAITLNGLPGSFYLNASNLSGVLNSSSIPNLDASKISSGIFSDARLAGNYSGITTLCRNTNASSLFLKGGDLTAGSGAFIHLYGSSSGLNGAMFVDASATNIRDVSGTFNYATVSGTGVQIHYGIPSTSTTSGSVVVNGGVGIQGAANANLFSGLFQLKTYTTASEPVASVSTIGQIWLNINTGKIKFVATASTIETITST